METLNRLENRSAGELRPCIWMQAGVVRRKLCKSDYNCMACHFDRIMGRVAEENKKLRKAGKVPQGRRGKIVSWKDKLKEYPTWKRPCLHYMKARIKFRACNHEYCCSDCEFDQYFHDQYTVHAVVTPVEVLDVNGFSIPQGYYFHRGHTWVKIEEGSSVRVGMDDFALRLLGPLDRIEVPLMGKEVRQARADISVSRGIHQAKVLSPVNGVVTAINSQLRDEGRLANEDPFSGGWIMRVHPENLRQDLKNLMINTETRDFMVGEAERLYQVIEEVGGPLSTDGGYLGNDIYGSMPQLGWERLIKLFFRT
jgi:glycine cleavage system H lipoate-binding protein